MNCSTSTRFRATTSPQVARVSRREKVGELANWPIPRPCPPPSASAGRGAAGRDRSGPRSRSIGRTGAGQSDPAAGGAVRPEDGSRLAFVLRATAATLVEGELEQRLQDLEEKHGK